MSNDFDPVSDRNVEQLMEVIARRAESHHASLAVSSPGMTSAKPEAAKPAPDTMETRLNDALRAQVAFNAAIVDSLGAIVCRLDHANGEARHAQREPAENAELQGLAVEIARLQAELAELRETTQRLEQCAAVK